MVVAADFAYCLSSSCPRFCLWLLGCLRHGGYEVNIVSICALISTSIASDNLVTMEDVKVAIAASSFLGADTPLLRIQKVSTQGSLRRILMSSSDEDVSACTASSLLLEVKGRRYQVTCNVPKKPEHKSYSNYDLSIRDSMFLQASAEALNSRPYKGFSLHRFYFAGHSVSVQDEYNLVFGNMGAVADFDDQYRLVKFKR